MSIDPIGDEYPSIINATAARPIFGVGTETPTPADRERQAFRLGGLCCGLLFGREDYSKTEGCSNTLMDIRKPYAQLRPDELALIDPAYRKGNIEVTVGYVATTGFHITLTYSETANDEYSSYDKWIHQSNYRFDTDGLVIREDRLAPSEEDNAMGLLQSNQDLEEIRSLHDRHIAAIQALHQQIIGQIQKAKEFDFGGITEERDREIALLEDRYAIEGRRLMASIIPKLGQNSSGSQLLKELGMNEQPVPNEEFDELLRLVGHFFEIDPEELFLGGKD